MNEARYIDDFADDMKNDWYTPPIRVLEIPMPGQKVIIKPKIQCVKCRRYIGFNIIEMSLTPVIEIMPCDCEREKETQMLIDSLPDLLKKAGYDLDKIKKVEVR